MRSFACFKLVGKQLGCTVYQIIIEKLSALYLVRKLNRCALAENRAAVYCGSAVHEGERACIRKANAEFCASFGKRISVALYILTVDGKAHKRFICGRAVAGESNRFILLVGCAVFRCGQFKIPLGGLLLGNCNIVIAYAVNRGYIYHVARLRAVEAVNKAVKSLFPDRPFVNVLGRFISAEAYLYPLAGNGSHVAAPPAADCYAALFGVYIEVKLLVFIKVFRSVGKRKRLLATA